MENASKALIMVGGLLIAIFTLGALFLVYRSSGGFLSAQEKELEVEQIRTFNGQYEAYNKKLLRGVDVISVINKVLDNNQMYKRLGENNYLMQVKVTMIDKIVYKKEDIGPPLGFKETYTVTATKNEFNMVKNDSEAFTDFKRRIFDCTKIEYHPVTGRVCRLEFTERRMTQDAYENGIY